MVNVTQQCFFFAETAMGTELNSQLEDVESDYVKAVHR
jgi:hypothetical protein